MKKHLFLLGWQREGRTINRYFDAYIACEWPFGPEATWTDVQAMSAMTEGDGFPKEVEQFCKALWPMSLRSRYAGADVSGPYLIDDDQSLSEHELLAVLNPIPDEEIRQYLYRSAPNINQPKLRRR